MNIFVVGATGRVATELIKDLVADGHEVIAGARRPEAVIDLDHVKPVLFDLHEDEETLAETIGQNVDAIYFTAGSRGKDLLQTDAYWAVKVMKAAEQLGIKRFIMLSAVYANQPQFWKKTGIEDYQAAKFFANEWLKHRTNLDYTILRPGILLEAKNTFGKGIDMSDGETAIKEAISKL
ncbi:hypothetical protein HMPREF9318_01898 [Streptococcus urinalis FB127-CNA-2]|uniref:NAD dependent epimerase/dehydratase family protein n=1 Tax=Streptococcus urinalis 2285-97 TaxID=764291 RepID=G5KDD6_9STRE|nr:NAD(P)-binding oxidoreductase [Streptococcus urinalis]EHJ55911.1 NAD dependent epimerase/dehydratase family protein [Streptococcus urinalis 2285-97]EKS17449.1 hypothetical protein HMPREF9318_01898 [Streptococcus urinalis FB127-CNA-2]VEF32729.1 NmrA-like dehydrogenase/reductase [Streptococcus urinalis]